MGLPGRLGLGGLELTGDVGAGARWCKLAVFWHSGRARAAAGRSSALFSSMASKKCLCLE